MHLTWGHGFGNSLLLYVVGYIVLLASFILTEMLGCFATSLMLKQKDSVTCFTKSIPNWTAALGLAAIGLAASLPTSIISQLMGSKHTLLASTIVGILCGIGLVIYAFQKAHDKNEEEDEDGSKKK